MRASPLAVVVRIVLAALCLCADTKLLAQPTEFSRYPTIRALREVLDVPEAEIDFAKAKVSIDRLIDPSIDAQDTLARIDAEVAEVRAMLPITASTEQRAAALRTYLYDPGPWNRVRVFGYNFDHPDGTYLPDKLLANYLRTRKGNCVSMPFLYIAMAQKLGLTVSAAVVPTHVFAKLRDDTGIWHNIETTSGGYTRRDVLYQQDYPMTQQALTNGLYMRPLNKRETVLVMAQVLAEHYAEAGPPELLIATTNLLLDRNPKDVDSMLHKGYAYGQLIRQRFASKYPTPRDIPVELREDFLKLRAQADLWYDKAEKLGWRKPSKEEDQRYLSILKDAAAAAKKR